MNRLLPTLLVCSALASACAGPEASASSEARRADAPRPVTVVPAMRQPLERAITVTGTLAADEQVALSLKVTGRIAGIDADLGTPVRRGQVLARLDPRDFELRVAQAQAALDQARARLGLPLDGNHDVIDSANTALVRQARAVLEQARLTHDRTKTFVERGISSRADLDAAIAALEVAEGKYQDALEEIRNRQGILAQRTSELALARQMLEDTILHAPIDGAVRERHATAGEYRTAGTPILTVVQTNPLRLRLSVPERVSTGLRDGQDVRVRVDGLPAVHQGRVARIGAAIDETNRTLPIEASVANPSGALRPGMFANAEIVLTEHDSGIVVPADAILTFAGVQKVLTVRDGKAREQRIRSGRRTPTAVEVLEGVTAGDLVIVKPGDLVDGAPVRVSASGVPGVAATTGH